jgi:hypothetical protein
MPEENVIDKKVKRIMDEFGIDEQTATLFLEAMGESLRADMDTPYVKLRNKILHSNP